MLGGEAGAADQRAVHVAAGKRFGGVLRLDRAAIENADAAAEVAVALDQGGADRAVHILDVVGRGDVARADRPDRLIGDDQLALLPRFGQRTGQLKGSLPDAASGPAELVVAYEPIWAIGTGNVATAADVAEMHAAIRADLVERFGDLGARIRILYGGSVKPDNVGELFAVADVDGALVGGASLDAAGFVPIIEAAARS